MSHKLKVSDMAPPTNPDAGAWFCAMVGGMAGLVLAYKVTVAIGFNLTVHWMGLPVSISGLVNFVIVVTGIILIGAQCYYLGSLIDKRLVPRVEQAILDAADKAAKHPQHGGKW